MVKRERIQKLFGEVVKKERKRQKLTQSDLAERSNLDNTYISQIERGLANPSIYTAYKISGSLGLSEYEVFQKMSMENGENLASSNDAVDELEIIYNAIVKLDASLLLTTTHDDDYRIIYCNDAFLKFTNSDRSELIGKKFMDILADGKNDKDLHNYLSQLKDVPSKGEFIAGFDENGKDLDVKINASPILSKNNQVEKHLFILQKKLYKIKSDSGQESSHTVDKYKTLLTETNHRLKNNLAIIVGIIDIKILDAKDNDTRAVLKDTQLRISAIAHIHELLTNSEDHSKIEIREYLENLTSVITSTYEFKKGINLKTVIGIDNLGMNEIITLGLLINELVTNSYKYAFPNENKGEVNLRLNPGKDGKIKFYYSDNGRGFDKRIFEKGQTLGFSLIHAFLEQLQASEVNVDTENGFKLEFEM
ncbi:MAG: helix-turn-helix domain-containing protein [Gracilimonas sp.]|uniref:histidine kinase dimerization/phosphoacceptor domain -containing protein n=1 Tax=Gracilimonas sp. TaxID=1974203 RepID=UPI00198C5767|nr:histidine kinase dimerization/phosphoacceptor domain -containing protein [Gracilimonas sp.]MBD3617592.1 helix-turn-helix domain-containing protein [Gracilimonas sp.]